MSTAHTPAGAGPATPEAQKCEGPGHHPQANANRNTTDDTDSAQPEHVAQLAEEERKRFAGLAARLAIRGHELHQLGDGTYLVARWGLTKSLPSLDDVTSFCQQVGA